MKAGLYANIAKKLLARRQNVCVRLVAKAHRLLLHLSPLQRLQSQ
jgi:hypothetical protein